MIKEGKIFGINEALNNLYNRKYIDLIKGLENKFDYVLRENDLLYENKIKFEILHSHLNDYYRIKILPAKKGFDSQKYFVNKFETEPGDEKLGKFSKENNVGLITY